MSIAPLYTGQGSSPSFWEWGQNFGWSHFEHYHWKCGEKSHVVHLDGGTPWRFPTSYIKDIYNIKVLKHIRTAYPDGGTWDGLPFGSGSDVFFAMDAEGWSPGNAAFPNFDPNLWNECTTKALNKISSQKADIGSNIAESRQISNSIASTSSQIFKAMLALKRGDLRLVAKELGMSWRQVLSGKFLANRWLEYQFGWKPLLSDIYNGYQKFNEVVNRDLIVTGTASAKREHSNNDVRVPDGNFRGGYTVNEKAFCRLDAIISIPELRQANQWNLINPLSVAWEVMPWSFAIDWFVPVGNVLEAMSARAGLQFLSGSVSQVRETRQTTRFAPDTHVGGYTIVTDGEVTIEKFQHRRNPIYDFPTPTLYTKDNPFSSTHIANALALWRQIPGLR